MTYSNKFKKSVLSKEERHHIKNIFKMHFDDVDVFSTEYARCFVRIIFPNMRMHDFDTIKQIASQLNMIITDIAIFPYDSRRLLIQILLD